MPNEAPGLRWEMPTLLQMRWTYECNLHFKNSFHFFLMSGKLNKALSKFLTSWPSEPVLIIAYFVLSAYLLSISNNNNNTQHHFKALIILPAPPPLLHHFLNGFTRNPVNFGECYYCYLPSVTGEKIET